MPPLLLSGARPSEAEHFFLPRREPQCPLPLHRPPAHLPHPWLPLNQLWPRLPVLLPLELARAGAPLGGRAARVRTTGCTATPTQWHLTTRRGSGERCAGLQTPSTLSPSWRGGPACPQCTC